MTIKAIQDKLYQYGYNWQYTWTGKIYVSKVNTCYQIFRSWNKDSETTNVELTVNENKNGYFAAWLKWTDDTGTGHIQYIKQKTVW